ncbi:MAG TPA: polysaccharide pyruvyl transferase family protein [Candidatus Saccharimonadales bacterium]|nr:polysaccharide pyruvyl transferase family protein [Candidatus Saccharimonadales bacterium]
MKLTDVLANHNLDKSLLIGYYGGGNYGDELLLEVLANLLKQQGTTDVTITYRDPEQYAKYHHEFGYPRIDMQSRVQLLKHIVRNKNILIGGGGLWGVDMNFNTFLLSLMLFMARFVLGKRVYLLGVGYYNSTNTMGRIAAWFAGKAATAIIARDSETLDNFGKLNPNTHLDTDMAWHVSKVNLEDYRQDADEIERRLTVRSKTLVISLRRPQSKVRRHEFTAFTNAVGTFIKNNPEKPIIVALLESEAKSPEEYLQARRWVQEYPNVQLLDFPHNPLALFAFFRRHNQDLTLIGPQFHIIITAHLTGVPFAPLVYDNKVSALFDQIGVTDEERVAMKDADLAAIQSFADQFYGSNA